MIGFCPLASGSRGNCLFLGSSQTRILIDAGISGKGIKERLSQIDVLAEDIDAILVSHEHTDHIQGLKVLSGKMGKPILANHATAEAIQGSLKKDFPFKLFSTGETFYFGNLEIHPFSIQHDAEDPVAFTIHFDSIKLGICTDLGFASTLVRNHLQGCDYLYIEANHDPSMVHACPRPYNYKQRVLSRSGHLSNEACADLILDVYHPELKQIYLAHLSSECNSPEKAKSTIQEILRREHIDVPIHIAHQDKISMPCLFPEIVKT